MAKKLVYQKSASINKRKWKDVSKEPAETVLQVQKLLLQVNNKLHVNRFYRFLYDKPTWWLNLIESSTAQNVCECTKETEFFIWLHYAWPVLAPVDQSQLTRYKPQRWNCGHQGCTDESYCSQRCSHGDLHWCLINAQLVAKSAFRSIPGWSSKLPLDFVARRFE